MHVSDKMPPNVLVTTVPVPPPLSIPVPPDTPLPLLPIVPVTVLQHVPVSVVMHAVPLHLRRFAIDAIPIPGSIIASKMPAATIRTSIPFHSIPCVHQCVPMSIYSVPPVLIPVP